MKAILATLTSAIILCSCANRSSEQTDTRERNTTRSNSRDPLDQLEDALDREGDRWDRIEDKWDRRF